MNRFLKIRTLFIGGFILIIGGLGYFLSTDTYSQARFRTMQDPIPSQEKVDLTGLRDLPASGGPVVHFLDLKKKLQHVNKKIIIVDALRQYHGYVSCGYLKEIPTTFFAYDRRTADWKHLIRRAICMQTTAVLSHLVTPEKEVAEKYGFDYRNIQIDSRISTPDKAVDEFVAFFDTLPSDAWIHFHCRLGKGRTSIMLVMFDTMKNAPHVALKDIVRRQFLLGSENLFNIIARGGGAYFSSTLKKRKKFIEDFYAFICQRKAGGIQRWSDWHKQQKDKEDLS